jgi:hypothetical protein
VSYCALCTVHYRCINVQWLYRVLLCTVHCALSYKRAVTVPCLTVHCALCSDCTVSYCALCSDCTVSYCALCAVQSALTVPCLTVHCALYKVHSLYRVLLCTVRCTKCTNCTVSYCALCAVQSALTVPAHKHSVPVLSVDVRRNLFLHNWFDLDEVKDWLLYKFMSAGWQFECYMTVRQEARFGVQ